MDNKLSVINYRKTRVLIRKKIECGLEVKKLCRVDLLAYRKTNANSETIHKYFKSENYELRLFRNNYITITES